MTVQLFPDATKSIEVPPSGGSGLVVLDGEYKIAPANTGANTISLPASIGQGGWARVIDYNDDATNYYPTGINWFNYNSRNCYCRHDFLPCGTIALWSYWIKTGANMGTGYSCCLFCLVHHKLL